MATQARGRKSRQQVEMQMKWNRGGWQSLDDTLIGIFLLKWCLPFSRKLSSHAVTRTYTHLIYTDHAEHRFISFRSVYYLVLNTYGPCTLFICYITCFGGNNHSSGGLFIPGRVLGRYNSMLHDCLITESHVSYHSALWWDLKHGCLALFFWAFLLPHSQCLQIRSKKRVLATRALIQSVSSSADPNPLTPQPNVWNLLL